MTECPRCKSQNFVKNGTCGSCLFVIIDVFARTDRHGRVVWDN